MASSYQIQSFSAAETRAIAERLAAVLRPPICLLLQGSLGAGKTQFAQGFARGLGVREQVNSPTFALLHRYPTASGQELLHFDLYRLDDPYVEFEMLGFSELLETADYALVEWSERVSELWPETALIIRLMPGEEEGERRLIIPERLYEILDPLEQAKWQEVSA